MAAMLQAPSVDQVRVAVVSAFGAFLLLASQAAADHAADVSSLKPEELSEFGEQPAAIQAMLRYALGLTELDLGYQYGSSDPKDGGMDCSGTVFHILTRQGLAPPRQANTLYLWVKKAGNLKEMSSPLSLKDDGFKDLHPGDLLFWEGTYAVGERVPPTSHVMIYLGHLKSNGKPVMVGASSGRWFAGRARHGVSVFDFVVPRLGVTSKFVGYGAVPGLAGS